jgi:hypothetical protein
MVEQAAPTVPPVVSIGTGPVTKWFPVTTVAELGNRAIKFTKAELIGYVVRCDDTAADTAERGKIIAVSAACTHKGCIKVEVRRELAPVSLARDQGMLKSLNVPPLLIFKKLSSIICIMK